VQEIKRFEKQVRTTEATLDRRRADMQQAIATFENSAVEYALACDRLERARERAASATPPSAEGGKP
jgi:hypothetical protein